MKRPAGLIENPRGTRKRSRLVQHQKLTLLFGLLLMWMLHVYKVNHRAAVEDALTEATGLHVSGGSFDRYLCMLPQTGASKLSPELSQLVVYTRSVPFKSFEEAAKSPASNMSSFSESEALRLAKDSGRM